MPKKQPSCYSDSRGRNTAGCAETWPKQSLQALRREQWRAGKVWRLRTQDYRTRTSLGGPEVGWCLRSSEEARSCLAEVGEGGKSPGLKRLG